MAKLVFGKRPPSFPLTVSAKDLAGDEMTFTAQCKYMTQMQWAALMDRLAEEEKQADKVVAEDRTVTAAFADGQRGNARLLVEVIESWDIEGHPINLENAMKLCDEMPAMAQAFKEKYRDACVHGKLGN